MAQKSPQTEMDRPNEIVFFQNFPRNKYRGQQKPRYGLQKLKKKIK